jgi:hypothetical protein
MWDIWGRGEVHTGLWWGTLKERDNFLNLGVDGRILLEFVFKKWDGGLGGCVWNRIGTAGGVL